MKTVLRQRSDDRKLHMALKMGFRGLRIAAAAGIATFALGILPLGPADGLLTKEGGAALRALAAESSSDEVFGRVDTFTGEKISEEQSEGQTSQISQNVWITDNMFYDPEKKAYGYYVGEEIVYANVADGMIVRDKVTVTVPDGVAVAFYRNGEEIEYPTGGISDRGNYTVRMTTGEQARSLFSFTIVGSSTGQILNYSMPDGLRITNVTRDGETVNWSRKFVDMSQEGYYVVEYECPQTQISYTLNVTIDTTPPQLVLEGVDENGKARGPVTIAGKGEYDTVSITKDGEEYKMILSHTLTQSGRYVVTAVDEAGNISTYPFTIMIYLDRNGWIFLLLFLAVILGAVAYVYYHRTHLKIR